MTRAKNRALRDRLHVVLVESSEQPADAAQWDVVIPDSPYSPTPIPTIVMMDAAKGVPYVHAVSRFYATEAVPFDGWSVCYRRAR